MKMIVAAVAGVTLLSAAVAGEMAVPDEAKQMSEKARDTVNETGAEKAFAAFADPNGGFRDRDLYVFCIDMEGVLLSQPIKPELVGKDMYNFNKYGDLLFQDMVALAKGSGDGWVDFGVATPIAGCSESGRASCRVSV